MNPARLLSEGIARILPFHNRRTVCPPGRLQATGATEPFLLVASLPRSGTHLSIDAVINNFPPYRRSPLYLDLLLCEWQRYWPDREVLERSPGYVVKSHYDGVVYKDPTHQQYVDILVELGAVVLVLERDREALRRSQQNFLGERFDPRVFERQWDAFFAFWEPRQALRLRFEDMVDPEGFESTISRIGEAIELKPVQPLRRPARPDQVVGNYLNKLATRLLGRSAPTVSTGIGFRKTRR